MYLMCTCVICLCATIIFEHATFVVRICTHLLYILHLSHLYVRKLLARCYRTRVIWFPAAVISQQSNVLSGHFCNQSFCHQEPRLLNRVEKALLRPIFGTWFIRATSKTTCTVLFIMWFLRCINLKYCSKLKLQYLFKIGKSLKQRMRQVGGS